MKKTTWAVLGSAVLSFFAPASAHAKAFATDTLSLELGDAPVCFVVPASLHDATACRGLPPAGAADIDNSQIGLIAVGGIRPGPRERESGVNGPLIGLVQMFSKPASSAYHPDAASAERVAVDAAKIILADLPSDARRGRPLPRIENVDGLVVVRTSVDVDGLTAGTRASFFAHIETATVFGRDATYTVVWSGPATSTAALGRIADEATKTIRLIADQHPATPATLASVTGSAKALAPLGGVAVVVAVAGVLYLRKRRGKGRRLHAELWPAHTD